MRLELALRFARRSFVGTAGTHERREIEIGGRVFVFLSAIVCTAHAQSLTWVQKGPGPNTLGQVESIADPEVVGAIQDVALHPVNPDVVYVGAVNGGIWKTVNAMAASPSWEH